MLLILRVIISGSQITRWNFVEVLNAFRDCSITRFHYFSLDSNEFIVQTEIDESFKISQILTLPILHKIVKIYHFKEHRHRPISSYVRHHAYCKVYIWSQDRLLDTFFGGQNREPGSDFVWILAPLRKGDDISNSPYIDLISYLKPTIFMEIVDFQQFSLICIPCLTFDLENAGTVSIRTIFPTMHDLVQEWRQLHGNMNSAYVDPETFPYTKEFYTDQKGHLCSSLVDADTCSLLLISLKHNFSLSRLPFSNPLHGFHFYAFSGLILSKSNLRIWRKQRRQVIPYSTEATPFAFIVIYDADTIKGEQINGILKPLKWWIWVIICGASSLFSGIFALESRSWRQFLEMWATLWALLVDQSVPAQLLRGCKVNKVMILIIAWGTWGLFCNTISQAYKSSLFSCLSAAPNPEKPENLPDLLESGLLIGTLDKFFIGSRGDQKSSSMLMGAIIPDILQLPDVSETILKLEEEVIWFRNTMRSFTWNSLRDDTVSTGKGENDTMRLPKRYALLDPIDMINRVKLYLEIFGSQWISKPNLLSVFMSRSFWVGCNNYFFPFFAHSLAQLDQAGIIAKWQLFLKKEHQKWDIKKILKELLKMVIMRKNVLIMLSSLPKRKVKMVKLLASFQVMSTKRFWPIFLVALVFP